MRETGSVVSVDGSLKISGSLEVTGSAIFTDGVSGSFSGSFQGNGNGLTNIPASGIVGLNLTQIADSNISASVSSTGTPFRVRDGITSLFEINNVGGITTFSTSSLQDIQVTGSAVIQDILTVENTLLVSQSTTLSGSIQTSGSTTLTGNNTLVGTTEITGSATIISDAQVTGSINVSGSTNTVGTVTITGSLTVSGSSTLTNIGPAEFTGSTSILGTLNTEGTSSVTGTSLVSGSTILSGSLDIEGITNVVGITTITGSTLLNSPAVINVTSSVREGEYALSVSQSAWFYNHNAGVPRSNAWRNKLNGSYFNNFDSNTNVSEILRFIAGLLSSSAPDASPNTRYYNAINNNSPSLSNSSIAGYVPQDFAGSDIIYLNTKGFANTGSTIFNGVGTVYTTLNPTYNFTSVSDGPTIVSSSADAQLFGLGTLGTAFNVSGALNWRFDDNFTQVITETSSSQTFSTRSTIGASSPGLTIGEIQTVNPDVIPNAYQDGKFNNIFGMTFYTGSRSSTSVSSSGWYHISASIGVQSGSSNYSSFKNNFTKVFAAPITYISIPSQTITFTQSVTPLTATSRSLSGAPYLQTATWDFQVTSSGVFEPLYYGDSTIFNVVDNSTLVTPTGTTTQLMSDGDILGTSLVYDSTGATQRTTGTIPFRTDRIQTSLTETFTAGTTDENINQTGLGTTSYTVTSTSYNRSGTPSSTGSIILFHSASTFGQPLASGSMAYYGRAQGGDTTSLTSNSETFSGESYRLKIDSALLTGSYQNGTKFTTSSVDLYNLGALDLQVKPGYLVRPGGTYKYWLTDPDSTKDYKFYARAFRVTSPYSTLYIDIGKTLDNWISTTTTASAAIIFNSVFANGNLSGTFGNSNPILFDVASILSTGIEANNQSTDDFINPFSTNINVYGNVGGTKSSTKYGIGLNSNTLKQVLNPSASPAYVDFVVLIRYKGDVIPITTITQTNA
jgi:trimeric autotransporter adhesin